jgi:hypothetical protein
MGTGSFDELLLYTGWSIPKRQLAGRTLQEDLYLWLTRLISANDRTGAARE